MGDKFSIDGVQYRADSLNETGKQLLKKLTHTLHKLDELNAEKAFLNRAKNGYISDLKFEITEAKSGLTFDALFQDE